MLQNQFYWYNTVHYCPSTSPTDMIQSTTAMVQACQYGSPLLSQYQFINMIGPPILQYQFYWYNTVHYCVSTSPTDTIQSATTHTSYADTLQFTTTPVPVLLISYNLLLPQYQSYWYDSTLLPRNIPTYTLQCTFAPIPVWLIRQSATVPVPVLLIPSCSLLLQCQSYWYDTVHFCPSTSLTYSLLICHSSLLAKYRYPTVNYCLNTSLIDTTHYTSSTVPVQLTHYSTLQFQYQP